MCQNSNNILEEIDSLENQRTTVQQPTCLIIIVDEGRAERFPVAPAAKSNAASPQALPTQRVKIGGLTYLQ